MKWTLNRAEQAKNTKALLDFTEVHNASNVYKLRRPSQILQSEKFVSHIIEVLKEERYYAYNNTNIPKEKLVNLSSAVALPDQIASTYFQ